MNISGKAVLVTFYKSMDDLCQGVLQDMGLDISVIYAYNQTEAHVMHLIGETIENGAEIVITRGTLAHVLRQKYSVKIIEIVVSSYDVLKTLYQYVGSSKKLGCIECDTFSNKVREVAELLGIDIKYYAVEQFRDFQIQYEQAVSDGIEVIFGGAWGKLCSEFIQLPYAIIDFSESAIRGCLENAMAAYEMMYEEQEKKDYLNTILNHSEEGILSVDRMGRIRSLNSSAAKILQSTAGDLMGSYIGDFFEKYKSLTDTLNKSLDNNVVIRYKDTRLMLSRVPILVEREVTGAIFFFFKTERIQEAERKIRLDLGQRGLMAKHSFEDIQTKNSDMRKIIDIARVYSRMDSTVLIHGETGAGKEYFAQAIHNASPRRKEAFVAVNCAALPGSLLESEMFGYVEGAFTGARKSGKQGIFETAHKGTIFMDEIGEIELAMQAHLLRVIQEREVMRIGDDKVIPVDVRIITATNRNLKQEVAEGRFRRDLYYRLNVLNIDIPPLRKRREDLKPLIRSLVEEKNQALGCKVTELDARLLQLLERYLWPGNIRELSNIIEKIVALTQSGLATYDAMSPAIQELKDDAPHAPVSRMDTLTMEELEREFIVARLKTCNFNKYKTAKSLGIGKATLFRKIEKYGLNKMNS